MNKKLKKYIVAISFFVVVQVCMGMFLFASEVRAAEVAESDKRDYVLPKLNFAIGDFGKNKNDFAELERQKCNLINGFTSLQKGDNSPWCYTVPWLGQYVEALYKYGLIIGSVLATLMVIVGGFLYMTSGLNPSGREKGKQMIISSVVGLVLLMGSYTLLKIINPTLTELPSLTIEAARPIVLPPTYCEDIENAEKEYGKTFKIGDPIKPDTDEDDPGCGDEFKVELLNEEVAKERVIASDAKCVYSGCNDATNGCVEVNDKFTCKPVLFYGSIETYRGGLLLLDEGAIELTGYIQDDGNGFGIRVWGDGGGSLQNLSGAGKPVNYNVMNKTYYFTRNQTTLDSLNNFNDTDPLFLQITINEPHLVVGVGSYEKYWVGYGGSPVGFKFGLSNKECCSYTAGSIVKNSGGCRLYTVGALKQRAIRLDIDTGDYFSEDGKEIDDSMEHLAGMPSCRDLIYVPFTPVN
jgi:hypothetical protein